MKKLKQILSFMTIFVLAAGFMSAFMPKPAAALSGSNFKAGRIIDDPIFFDNNRMDVAAIQQFLQSKVPVCDTNGTKPHSSGMTRAQYAATKGISPPFTCLKDFRQDVPSRAADAYCWGAIGGGNKSAAQIIKEVGDACSVNPMSLLVILQKEQALVTDEWPWPSQYQKATGYGCPAANCDPDFAGFFNQVYYAARQFHRYATQPQLFNHRFDRTSYVPFHSNSACGGTGIYMETKSTAGIYNYDPFQPNGASLNNLYGTGDGCSSYGNRNFWRMFNDWFGTTVTSFCAFDTGLPVVTDVMMRKMYPNIDSGDLVIYSGTSTQCIESHTWGNNFASWIDHTASNQKVLIPTDCTLKFADLSGDGRDEPTLICFRNTGSGMVDFHVWNYDMKSWIVHAISNLPAIDPTKVALDFGDMNGDGKEEPIAIGFSDTSSGNVELHYWNDGLKSWRSHIITNLPVINPANMNIAFADLDGDRVDEAMAIGVAGTSTGKIEFHVWAPGQWAWQSHIVSSQPLVDMGKFGIQFGNFNGGGSDQGVLIGRQGTASGRIEFHIWNPGFGSWAGHSTSNQPTF